MTSYLERSPQRRLAFAKVEGTGPSLVFLSGFKSDMTGSKAMDLQDWAASKGQSYLRMDYSGHGQSSGRFIDGCIGDWCADAAAVIEHATKGQIILVGSSMGGWISLLLARQMPDRIAGLIGIASAPDFTDDIWDHATADQQAQMTAQGFLEHPSDYGPEPDFYTLRLIEDGRRQRIFDRPLTLPFPTRWLQGTADTAVPVSTALRLLEHADGPDIRLTLVKGADHRFSSPECLSLIHATVQEVLDASTKAQP